VSTLDTGTRVYAKVAIRYRDVAVIHKGGKGTVVQVLSGTPYVRWDWTSDTFPAYAGQLGRL
jgi:hypothetical protein